MEKARRRIGWTLKIALIKLGILFSIQKWDQKGWNMYFAIIFGNHVSSVFIPMVYCPDILVCVLSHSHLAAFIGMMINNVFVSEKKIGRGGKSKVNRIFWGSNYIIIELCVL